MISLFLDDERVEPLGFLRVSKVKTLIDFLTFNDEKIDILSLDHDLGDGPDGTEAVKWLVGLCLDEDRIKTIQFHTNNTVARKNMYSYLKSAQKAGVFSPSTRISSEIIEYKKGKLIYTGKNFLAGGN